MPCTTVTVEEQDSSEISIENVNATQTSRGSYTVSADVVNTVTSGSGNQKQAPVLLEVDGSFEAEALPEPPVGQSETVTFDVSGLSTGQHNICVELA